MIKSLVVRVLHILPNFGYGGAERMAVQLMQYLDRERFEVGAISLYDAVGTDMEKILAQSKIPVWYLGKRLGFDPRIFSRINAVLHSFKPHVVHTHQYVLRYVSGPALWQRIPAKVHTVHNLAEREVDWLGRWVNRVAFKGGVIPVAIAEEVADSLSRVYGIRELPLIPNAIPIELYKQSPADAERWRKQAGLDPELVLFVCVARLSAQKNHALLLEAFAQGPATDPHTHLLIVGEGELELGLRKMASTLGLADKVHFYGVRNDIPEILGAADVFVLASEWEGNPLSIMEAMASGTPVISTAVGGVPGLIEDGRSGLLVPRGDVKALAHAMRYMVQNPEIRADMGEDSRKRAIEHFDVRVMARLYEDLYERVLAAG
jgi:glycosyltransferase involved in cell wall biosynthesis